MSEKTRVETAPAPDPAPPAGTPLPVDEAGELRRLDEGHVADVSASPDGSEPDPLSGMPGALNSEQLLLQASKIAEHLSAQFNEVGRREQALIAQLNQIDQERRNVRLWVQQFEEEVKERDERIRQREATLNERDASFEAREAELAAQDQQLAQERAELERERAELRENLQAELESDRAALQEQRLLFERKNAELQAGLEENRRTNAQALADCQRQFEADRVALETDFAEKRKRWEETCKTEREALDRERGLHEEALRRSQTELAEREQRQRNDLDRERREHDEQLAQERAELDAERKSETTRIQQERVVMENRIRFQQEHLAKTRQQIEQLQHSARLEQQQRMAQVERMETILRLRGTQLDHYRSLLEERELSVDREHELLTRSRQAIEQSLGKDRARLDAERETWEQERQSQRAEIRRQQDVLALHAENLENRRRRLDQLRSELEDTHRRTLELRMAVEEACAQLAQAAGSSVAEERIEAARSALSDHYSQLRESILAERRETDRAIELFRKEKEEFRAERQTLTEWIGERDERLRMREAELRREAGTIETREAEWRAARDHWMTEKLEAETVIRGLLQQLSERNREIPALEEAPLANDAPPEPSGTDETQN
jgi:hypothetical protein